MAAELTEESTSRFIQLDDYRMHLHEAGNGEALILLHGGGPGASAWSNFRRNIPVLAQHFRVLAIDMVGYGKSDKPILTEEDFTTFNARAISKLLAKLGIERTHIAGNSYGGSVALVTALDYPQRVERIVLMGSSGAFTSFVPWPTDGIKALLNVSAPPGPTIEKMQQMFNLMLYDASAIDSATLEKRVQAATEPAHAAWLAASHKRNQELFKRGEVPRWGSLWQELHKIKNETLLLWGRDDRMMPFDAGLLMLRRLPDARMMIFSQCGHWVQNEKVEEFNRYVTQFLTLPSRRDSEASLVRNTAKARGDFN